MLVTAYSTVRGRYEKLKPIKLKWPKTFNKTGDVLKNRPNIGDPATVLINNILFFLIWKDVYTFQGSIYGAGYRSILIKRVVKIDKEHPL